MHAVGKLRHLRMNAEERNQPCAALSVAQLLAGAGRALAAAASDR
jgi:hypothetical protein